MVDQKSIYKAGVVQSVNVWKKLKWCNLSYTKKPITNRSFEWMRHEMLKRLQSLCYKPIPDQTTQTESSKGVTKGLVNQLNRTKLKYSNKLHYDRWWKDVKLWEQQENGDQYSVSER